MRERGLLLETPKGPLVVDRARCVEHPSEVGACEVVLFAVKAYDIEGAAAPLKPLVDGGACVVSVLNGVDHQDRIASVLGPGSVLGGLAMVSGVIVDPGVIRYTSDMSGLRFGEADGSMSARATPTMIRTSFRWPREPLPRWLRWQERRRRQHLSRAACRGTH